MTKTLLSLAAAVAMIGLAGAAQAQTIADTTPVAVVVKVPAPPAAGFTPDRLHAAFEQAIPQYRAIPNLARKYFTISEDGSQFGGVYLWTSYAAARAYYSPAWQEQVVKTYGKPATVEYFDAKVRMVGAAQLD